MEFALVAFEADAVIAALFGDPVRYLALAPGRVYRHGRTREAKHVQELRDRGRARQGPTRNGLAQALVRRWRAG